MNLGLEENTCNLKTWGDGGQRIEKFKVIHGGIISLHKTLFQNNRQEIKTNKPPNFWEVQLLAGEPGKAPVC